ncbi:MAG TPA: class I SAM-dependent methyltransferase [Gemmataceae bacterium]|nr:class I SAM-dependent methyltransferase [Gemmataceae bacterium]
MTGIGPCPAKSHADLAHEWDQLAEERHRQIVSGQDLSFAHVIVPTTWRLWDGADHSVMLDVGCGTGHFTARLAQVAEEVFAVEPSPASVAMARKVCEGSPNVRFVEMPIEEAASIFDNGSVTAAVAVMTLMTAPDLRAFVKALAALLRGRARFVATLAHPCFWPKYWGYEEEPWFPYGIETYIEAPFVISRHRSDVRTTHIHRPLDQYVTVFADEGFQLDALAEPMPSAEIERLYPAPWRFPRFLGLRWVKVG